MTLKKIFSFAIAALSLPLFTVAETIEVSGASYELTRLIDRDLGPGVHYTRVRLNDYPLNVNILTMDMNNPYNTIETTIPGDTQFGTELLVKAAERQSAPGHKALAGANANFFVTSGFPPYGPMLNGAHVVGCVRNGQIVDETNMYSDQWNGGYTETGIFFVDTDRNLHCEAWPWYGKVASEAAGNLNIYQVNKICRDGEVALYNGFYDRDMKFMPADLASDGRSFNIVSGVSTEVYMDLAPGQSWAVGKEVSFIVTDVLTATGPGTRGQHDAVLVGRGDKATKLAKMKKGETVTINLGWSSQRDGKGTVPVIDNLVGGNALIMKDGELTSQNYNPNNMGNYNPMTYSRCSYGSSADGRTLYICVIDKSTDPVYGASKGINTEGLCHIARHFGCANLVNMDAGGSAQMLVGDRIINRTTESTPRAVANGMIIYSTAPADDAVARLEFFDYELQSPIYGTFTPRIIAYNQYGDVINDDFREFTLSCDPSLGTCADAEFTASATPTTGELTASFGNVKVSKTMSVKDAEISIRIKNILIDNVRRYPMEVNARVGQNSYTYKPENLDWESGDADVATVENGVLSASKEGETTVKCTLGSFSDVANVKVEIAPAQRMTQSLDGWKAVGTTGVTSVSMDGAGVIAFKYGSPRTPYVKISKTARFYSLPDKLEMSFTPTVDVASLYIDLRSATQTRTNRVDIAPADGGVFAAGKTHTVEIPMAMAGDPADLASFPYTLYYIQFNIVVNSAYKGEQSITLNDLHSEYSSFMDGIDSITADPAEGIVVSPASPVAGETLTITARKPVESATLVDVSGRTIAKATCSGNTAMMNLPDAPAGVYLLNVETSYSMKTIKIVIK
ncbi:MAG: phosphodiester glycosidase family protein [Muribaculaceae bacterium]|nr:phosphodiester glycosidase family protein [Muribaculaceae bacterium]